MATIFIGSGPGKLDRKGRVSIPADFRASLKPLSFAGIYAWPSHVHPAIVCAGNDYIDKLQLNIETTTTPFTKEREDLETAFFADMQKLNFDPEGRVVLPASLILHAKLVDVVEFVSQRETFMVWNPENADPFKAAARQRAYERMAQRGRQGGDS